ncbi:zinc finger CCCH domain-containing protein 8 isoform X2 [Pipistrellus kuhlii]|uniref:zinc finger CCCH domain-containing protein 8 isoform X2 n=1 Tax=Pipistrellus kuhlii TaxID=59472 RepID=UPI00174F24AB|nr:zinc finger CCCH domain-containing protein 8 isoform X2 [Pipistrellus kuhlii]
MRRPPAGSGSPSFLSPLRCCRGLSLGSCGTPDGRMDFENLFSKPPNPALGKKSVTDSNAKDSDDRIDDEINDTEVEETQEEKIKVKVECEHIPKKFRHFGNSTTSPENLLHRKSRSKDYDVYTDNICNQEPEDTFAKELQQYKQTKEMANAAQSVLSHKESLKKEEATCTQKGKDVKQGNNNFKAAHKNGKQKKMKRKWPGTADKGPNPSLRNGGSPGQFRHFGNSTTSPKNFLYRKSRSRDYDVYTDNICNQEPEDTFAKELQQYIRAKEMANAAQTLLSHKESLKKEEAMCTQKDIEQRNNNFKAAHKNGKQKKMKRKWPGTADKGSNPSLRNRYKEQDGNPKEKQQRIQMNQGFINQHTVNQKGKQVCKYFIERKCIKGDECKFDHDAEIEKKKEMCKFYVQGYCTKGENCLYLHNEYPCKFYHTGAKCYQGESCKFSHAPLTAETQELLAKVLDTERKSS